VITEKPDTFRTYPEFGVTLIYTCGFVGPYEVIAVLMVIPLRPPLEQGVAPPKPVAVREVPVSLG
jgi:hypothetical protein